MIKEKLKICIQKLQKYDRIFNRLRREFFEIISGAPWYDRLEFT